MLGAWCQGEEACRQGHRRLYVLCRLHSAVFLILTSEIGDHVVNLREDIFTNRIKYSLTAAVDNKERDKYLNKAVKSLEK